MNAHEENRDIDQNKLFRELHALVESEEARKALKKSTKDASAKPRAFVSFPELAFPDGWRSPAAREELPPVAAAPVAVSSFNRQAFFGIEICTVTRNPAGVVEMMAFRNTDAAGYVTYQVMYSDRKPRRFASTSDC